MPYVGHLRRAASTTCTVAPAAHGTGLAKTLLARLRELGNERSWTALRWIAAESNCRACAKYDKVDERSEGITYYDMEVGSSATARQPETAPGIRKAAHRIPWGPGRLLHRGDL